MLYLIVVICCSITKYTNAFLCFSHQNFACGKVWETLFYTVLFRLAPQTTYPAVAVGKGVDQFKFVMEHTGTASQSGASTCVPLRIAVTWFSISVFCSTWILPIFHLFPLNSVFLIAFCSTSAVSFPVLIYRTTIRNNDIANGEGVRVSLFVSGCDFHCPGCFNPEVQNFEYLDLPFQTIPGS